MKENKDNQIENELEVLMIDESDKNKTKAVNKEINLNIFNYEENKIENYKFLNEEEELLLCKEETFNEVKSKKENKEENIKIKELYNGQDSNSLYYLNKNELKKKYLKIEENLNEDSEDKNSIFDNQDEKEMEKIYKESLLKHPRKVIDGEIKKYSFFSWSGFFCCNKRDYFNLGQAYVTYFNTIKLLIIIFLIIALIHIGLINHCTKFTSIYNFENDSLLIRTLGNTINTYFNITYFFFERNESYKEDTKINFDCG